MSEDSPFPLVARSNHLRTALLLVCGLLATLLLDPAKAQQFGSQQVITSSAQTAFFVATADLDGDGDQDVYSASKDDDTVAWYKNDGQGSFTEHKVTTGLDIAKQAYAADVDGDGDLDIVAAGSGRDKVVWFKNEIGEPDADEDGFGKTQEITGNADGAEAIDTGDLDGDGDLDVVSASWADDKVAWYENQVGESGADGDGFGSQQVISSSFPKAQSVRIVDIDDNGSLDVVAAAGGGNQDVAWFPNGGDGSFQEAKVVTANADNAQQVSVSDIDGDGDPDLFSASSGDNKIGWYANQIGEPEEDDDGFGEQQIISTNSDAAEWTHPVDLTGNGAPDVLTASTGDHTVAWHENQVGQPEADNDGFGVRHVITTGASGAVAVFAADLDGDDALDALSASRNDDKIAWYKNQSSGVDLEEGLVAYYPFNGSADDASGKGHDGTVNGATLSTDRFGNSESAYYFDGDDDHIIGDQALTTEEFSVSHWIKTPRDWAGGGADNTGTIYHAFNDESGDGRFRTDFGRVEAGTVRFFTERTASEQDAIYTNDSYGDDQWHHVVAVREGTGVENMRIFVDGEEASTSDHFQEGSPPQITTTGFVIGVNNWNSLNRDFEGKIDDIRVYDRALNEAEIQQLYSGENSYGLIEGKIVDAQTEAPLENATVSLENRSVSSTTGSDGTYSLFVKPGTGYTVTVGTEGYYSSEKSFVSVEEGRTTTVDLSLQPLSEATPVVTTLTPDPNPNSSSVGPGGQAIRYYKVISSENGTPLPNQPITVESEDGNSYTFRSDQSGVVSVSIPAEEVGNEGSSKTFSLTSVAGETIPEPEQRSFAVNVFSRVFTQGWALRTYGEIGAGLDFSGENTGQALLRGVTNSEEADELQIQRRKRGGVGVSLGVSTPRIEVGENGLGAGASVGSSLFFFRGDAYSFNWQTSQPPQEAAAQFYVWARSVFPVVSNNVIRLLSYVGENFVLDEELDASYEFDEFGVGNRTYGSASFQAGLGTLTDMTVGVKGGIGGDFEAYSSARWLTDGQYEIGGNLEAGFSLEAGATVPLLSVDPSDDGPGNSGDGRALREDLSDVGIGFEQLGGQAEVGARWQGGLGMGCQAGNTQYLFFETATSVEGPLGDISNSYPDGTEGVATSRRYRFEVEPALEPAWEGGAGNDTAQTLATSCGAEGVLNIGRSTFAGLIEALGGRAGTANEDPNLSYPPVEYSADSTLTTSESDVDLTLSVADVSVGLGGSFVERREATVEEGVWAAGRHYPTERYDNLPSLEASYKDVVLEVVGDIPSSFWESALDIVDAIPNPFSGNKIAAAQDSTYSYQIGDNGTTVVFDNEAVPPEVDSIQGVSWSWWGSSTNMLAKDLSPQSRQYKRKIKEKAQSNEGLRYGIGGFYRLKPLGTGLQAPAEITIHYAEEELDGVSESELAVYWENTDEGGWEYIGGTVDPDSNTVTAPIDTFRTFTLAPKLPSGSFELQPDSSSIDANGTDSTTVQSTALSHNDGSTVQDGALYTVETNLGTITSPDADTSRPGTQIEASGGKISFQLQSSQVPGTAELEARSVRGQSTGEGGLELNNTGPPSPVAISSVEGGDQSVTLTWEEASEPDLSGYKVYFGSDSTELGGVAAEGRSSPLDVGEATKARIPGLPNDTTTYVAVSAYDVAGAESNRSAAQSAVPRDTVPPGEVGRLRLTPAGDSSATLLWTAPRDNGSAKSDSTSGRAFEYRVRRAEGPVQDTTQWWENAMPIEVSQSPSEPGTREQVFVPAPESGATRYGVRAVDEAGNVSSIRFPSQWAFVDSDREVGFAEAGVSLALSVSEGSGMVSVQRFESPPSDTIGIAESNVSSYRFVLQAGDGLALDSSEVGFAVGSLGGIGSPSAVQAYKRPTVGTGSFDALATSVKDNGTPDDISDDTLAVTTGGFSEFVFASNSEPLPVELAKFQATLDGEGAVRLTWTTVQETGNVGFRVQRKAAEEAEKWATVGSVEGAGTTTEPTSYRYVDSGLPYEADRLTYRLKQVDTDGTVSYSKEVTVNREVTEAELLGTYPNPAQTRATLRYAVPERQDVTIHLYDILGRRVQTVVDGEREGRHKRQLDTSRLASGVYFLRLRTGDETKTQKLTVVR